MLRVIFISVFVSACATPMTYEQLRNEARTDSNDTLCLVQIVKPQYSQVAQDELAARGATCDWAKTQIQAQAYIAQQQAQSAAIMSLGAALMSNRTQPPQTTNCIKLGNGITCSTY